MRSTDVSPRCLARMVGALSAFLVLSAAAQAWAQVAPAGPSPSMRHRVGIYITELHSFDAARGTFGAGFWVWAVGSNAAQALRTMEFPNTDAISVRFESTASRGAVNWSQRKVAGTFRQRWDLRNYPFDRHVLDIVLEEGAEEEAAFVYDADAANSGHGLQEGIEGWRVRSMRFAAEVASYATSFGDPAAVAPSSRFSRLRASVEVERTDWTGFAKLTAPLYAGFLLCAIGCLVPVHSTTFAPRITVLVASLFAMVINMRSASTALGSEHGLTLIDRLHVTGLAYVVVIAAVTVLVRLRAEHAERGEDDRQRLARLDHWSCIVPAALFVAANIALLLRAATEG